MSSSEPQKDDMPKPPEISTVTLEKLRIIHQRLEFEDAMDEFEVPADKGWLGKVMHAVETESLTRGLIEEFGSPQQFLHALTTFLINKKLITKPPAFKRPAAPRAPDFMDRMQGHVAE
jgi:hypothetical protein